MNILIDNTDLLSYFGIGVLDYTGAFDFPAERENERTWADKSGVDKNLVNIRYEPKEFVLSCYVKAGNESLAYDKINALVDYMFTKGVFVLTLKDSVLGIRKSFLCERSNTIVGTIHIRPQNSLYRFNLGLKDVNPNAIVYQNTVTAGETTILYEKGRNALIYWGNGDRAEVSNSGNYTKSDYTEDGEIDIIIDIDKNETTVISLNADFSADVVSGIKPQAVQFTDTSTGVVEIWAWDFGDGSASSLQNPSHTYTAPGTYTVTLQVFNNSGGADTETKVNYITIRNAWMKRNDTEYILRNNTDKIDKN